MNGPHFIADPWPAGVSVTVEFAGHRYPVTRQVSRREPKAGHVVERHWYYTLSGEIGRTVPLTVTHDHDHRLEAEDVVSELRRAKYTNIRLELTDGADHQNSVV